MNGNCNSCELEKQCDYPYKPCDCFAYKKFILKKPEQQAAQVIEFTAKTARNMQAPPQSEQEPTKAMIDAAERINWSDSDVRGNIVNMWQAMCAAAPPSPQRKPLTDEQIDAVTDAQWAKGVNKPIYAAHRAYARAIEAAHDIKENT